MPGYKNITSVNYEQLELLLQYAVARKSANVSAAFASGNQYFLDVDSGALKIYTGASDVPIYNSESAFNILAYIKNIEWDGTNYTHKLTNHKADNTEETYSIEKVEKIDNNESTIYLPYLRIGANIYKIPRDWSDLTNIPSTFPPSSHTHTKSEITDFAHTHTISDITDFPVLAPIATSGNYSDLNGTPTIPDAVSGTNDGTNWTTITIGSVTMAIPSGGSGTPPDYIKSMSAANNTLSWTEVVNGIEAQQSYVFSGGSGGTSNYSDLNGKPQIGGVILASGNNTLAALGLQALIDASNKLDYSLLDNVPTIPDTVSGTNDGTNWTTITIGNVTMAIPAGGGSGEPAEYIKDATLSDNDHTLTLTKKDDTTVVFNDTAYSAATQSADGLMSSADKTKLDGLVSNKAEVLFSGLVDGNISTDLPSATIAQYSVILVTFYSQYAEAHKRTVAIPVSSIGNFSIQETIAGWNDPLNIYFYYDSDYLRCNGGSGHSIYITSVIGIKA